MTKLARVLFFILFLAPVCTYSMNYLPAWVSTQQDNAEDITYYEKAGRFSNVPQSPAGVDSLLNISAVNISIDTQKAAYASLQALELAESIRYSKGIADAHNELGTIYQVLGDYNYALSQFLIAMDMALENDEKERAALIKNNIGKIYLDQGNYKEAINYFKKTADISDEAENNDVLALAYSKLGLTYFNTGEYELALDHYEMVMQLTGTLADHERTRMETAAKIGNTYIELGEFEKAESYLMQAVQYFDQKEYTQIQSENYLSLAKLYRKWGVNEKALEYTQQGLQLAESIDELPYMRDAYQMLSEIFEIEGHDQETILNALTNYKHFYAMHDSLLNVQRTERIKQRQIRSNLEMRNREMAMLNQQSSLQEAQLRQQELWRKFLLICIVLLCVIAGLLYRNNLIKKRANSTLRHQADEISKQNEQLTRLNEEKSEFLEMAAHDLRNPLSAIKGVVQLMEEGKQDEEALKDTEIIKISTERMLGLIDNFLNVDAIEQGLNGHKIIKMDVTEPLEQSVGNFRKCAYKKEIHLSVNLNNKLQPVLADIEVFQRILDNLISNAIKFSPTGSAIEIFTSENSEFLDISVRDNGPGITEADQNKLFRRFGRLSNMPTANEPSSGLGLYIVKELSEAMGGRIRCESEPGKGSTFTVSFPLAGKELEAVS